MSEAKKTTAKKPAAKKTTPKTSKKEEIPSGKVKVEVIEGDKFGSDTIKKGSILFVKPYIAENLIKRKYVKKA